jgi:Xaa-Pro aminopeptidase
VRRVWPHARHADFNPVEALRASKTPAVLERFRDAFARSSAAIAETMRWAKAGEPGRRHTEYDLARKINDAYGARSAVALTFPSIAANGANSAFAHYTAASADVELTEGELVLLDSGAYYDAGFATDCTRVVLRRTRAETVAQPWQREIYTVALKACIKGLVTRFRTRRRAATSMRRCARCAATTATITATAPVTASASTCTRAACASRPARRTGWCRMR